ncbi:MAG: AAA family ATPase [Anaerolineaceae bacterium]|nr:AAA family ATPase [Anaerolineaceae bacterium]
MSTHRIAAFFRTPAKRLAILYGPGIEDTFVGGDLQEMRFEEALLAALQAGGVRRTVFFAPHKPLFFLDDDSRRLTFGEAASVPQSASPAGEMVFLSGGPLQRRLLIRPEGAVSRAETGMGDVHAIRSLDAIMRDVTGPPGAVVFLQAESLLRHFQDPRTLSGVIGEWARLPRDNPNRCIFCFSADGYDDLAKIATALPVPEIRTMIARGSPRTGEGTAVFHVGYPDAQEMRSLLTLYASCGDMQVSPHEIPKLAGWMSAEGLSVNAWAARLNGLETLDSAAATRAGWFSAVRHPDESLEEQFNRLTGLHEVKEKVFEIAAWLEMEKKRPRSAARRAAPPNLHMIFLGNPGSGKTTVARMFGEILHELGYLQRGHLVEVTGRDLIADHVGGTALKTHAVIDQALDGVLFIDEAYTLTEHEGGGFGRQALEALLTRMEDERGRLVVIAAGYQEKMRTFRSANPGLQRRFPLENIIEFPDFSPEELWEILNRFLRSRHLSPDEETADALQKILKAMWAQRDAAFGNAGEMRNLAEALDRRKALRLAKARALTARTAVQGDLTLEDIPESYRRWLPRQDQNLNAALAELDDLIGLEPVKGFLSGLASRIQLERLRSTRRVNPTPGVGLRHLVFAGSPGTGKTTVARLVGKIYCSLGLLPGGHCVEVSRADLVAGYVGQTALKTMRCVERALDGVLFIDEAYSLLNGGENDFGKEALDTLVKAMEDHKDRLVVILAGYSREIDQLIQSNPGLRSRFAEPLIFPGLTDEQMEALLHTLVEKEQYILPPPVATGAIAALAARRQAAPESFGNARAVIDLFDQMKTNLARRVMHALQQCGGGQPDEILSVFREEDVPEPVYAVPWSAFQTGPRALPPEGITNWKRAARAQPEGFQADGDTTPSVPGGHDDPPAPPVLERYQSPNPSTG